MEKSKVILNHMIKWIKIPLAIALLILISMAFSNILVDFLLPEKEIRGLRYLDSIEIQNTAFDIKITYVATEGSIYAGVPIETKISIIANRTPDSALPELYPTFTILFDNAAYGYDETPTHLPGFVEVPRYSDTWWNDTIWLEYQSYGPNEIQIKMVNEPDYYFNYTLSSDIYVEPWSSYFQIESNRESTRINVFVLFLVLFPLCFTIYEFEKSREEKRNLGSNTIQSVYQTIDNTGIQRDGVQKADYLTLSVFLLGLSVASGYYTPSIENQIWKLVYLILPLLLLILGGFFLYKWSMLK